MSSSTPLIPTAAPPVSFNRQPSDVGDTLQRPIKIPSTRRLLQLGLIGSGLVDVIGLPLFLANNPFHIQQFFPIAFGAFRKIKGNVAVSDISPMARGTAINAEPVKSISLFDAADQRQVLKTNARAEVAVMQVKLMTRLFRAYFMSSGVVRILAGMDLDDRRMFWAAFASYALEAALFLQEITVHGSTTWIEVFPFICRSVGMLTLLLYSLYRQVLSRTRALLHPKPKPSI